MKFSKRILGNISLTIWVILGIFFTSPIYASKTESISIVVTQKNVASFSFSVEPFKNRKFIHPDRVSFDTTGKADTTSPVPKYTADFPPWDNGYPVNEWSETAGKTLGSPINNYIQISQFPTNYPDASLRNKYLICSMRMSPNKLVSSIYGSASEFSGSGSHEITGSFSAQAFASVVSSTRAYCFWKYIYKVSAEAYKQELRYSSFNNGSWLQEKTMLEYPLTNLGLCGCLMTDSDEEYIAVAYPVASRSISILTFKDGNPDSYNITSGISVSGNISGAQISLTQNPRTGNIYLCWISNGKAYYRKGDFSATSSDRFTFSTTENEICPITDSNGNSATIYAGSFNNFETSFTISDDNGIKNFCLCGDHFVSQSLPESQNINKPKFSVSYQYCEYDQYYFGCFCLSKFNKFYAYSRLLAYPTQCSWQGENKRLHLEGPPRLNTKVTAEVDFAEMVPSSSFARCVNSEFVGGVRAFDSTFKPIGNRAVIASSSHCFFAIGFDKAMNLASYPSELNSSVKLTDLSNNTTIGLTNIASASGKLVFKPNSDLKLNSQYKITIASDVIDSIGSQIYKDEFLSFKTQSVSTPLEPDGVIDIEAFSDPGHTNKIIANSDIKSDKKLYLRINAYDPAFNTIDTTTVTVKENNSAVATLTLTQSEASSPYFYCEYQMSAPSGEDSNWIFESINPSIKLPLKVTYPQIAPNSPASATTGLEPSSVTQILLSASEEIDPSSIISSNLSLWQLATPVSVNLSYDSTNKTIVITPTNSLVSEKNYLVKAENLLDKAGNKQITPLAYYFSTKDFTKPAVLSNFPSNGATNVTIDTVPSLTFSEEIKSTTINSSGIKVLCNGLEENYSFEIVREKISIIFPNGLKPQSNYQITATTALEDFSGNKLALEHSYGFTTQPLHTPPTSISNLTLYKDPMFFKPFSNGEKVNASGSIVYIKLNGSDGATQTLDLATVSIKLNSILQREIAVYETASNSSGLFTGSYNLSDLGIYGFPTPIPSLDAYAISFVPNENPSLETSLNSFFPELTSSSLNTLSGSSSIGGATNVSVNTAITLNFSREIDSTSISDDSIKLSSGTILIASSKSLSANRKTLTLTPIEELPFASIITLTAPYNGSGLKDLVGNPIKGALNLNFTTQSASTAPTSINSIKAYSDSACTNEILSGSIVNPESEFTISVEAPDISPTTIDSITVLVKDSDHNISKSVNLVETSINSGLFRGTTQACSTENTNMLIFADIDPTKNISLKTGLLPISSSLTLSDYYPQDNSTSIPIDSWITWTFNNEIPESQLASTNFSLHKASPNVEIHGVLSLSPSKKQVRFKPNAPLELLKEYQTHLSTNLKDINGNLLGQDYTFNFKTQAPPSPPVEVKSFANYSSNDYLASTTAVLQNGKLYLQMTATDTSFSTYEVAKVRMDSSDGTYDGVALSLIETNPPSGVFRLEKSINLPLGTKITLTPQVNESFKIVLTVKNKPSCIALDPAPEAVGIYLDQSFFMTFSDPINSSTIENSIKITDSNGNNIPYHYRLENPKKLVVTPTVLLAADQRYNIAVKGLKDSEYNQSINEFTYRTTTKSESIGQLELYTGLAPCDGKKVSLCGEAILGNLGIAVSTDDMLEKSIENRVLRLSDLNHHIDINLEESCLNSNLYLATTTITSDFVSPIKAELLFGAKPSLSFSIATKTCFVSANPTENGMAPENTGITAAYSRKIYVRSAIDGAKVSSEENEIGCDLITTENESKEIKWQPRVELTDGYRHTLAISGLLDYLGQSVENHSHIFYTSKNHGISLYKDSNFTIPINSREISEPNLYIEVIASGSRGLSNKDIHLDLVRGTESNDTKRFKLEPIEGSKRVFRGMLKLTDIKSSIPAYSLSLYPGEWVNLSSALLTSNELTFYYRCSESKGPSNIKNIKFFSDKNYTRRALDEISNPSLYIQLEAEDANWLTEDKTRVLVTSDDDKTGFVMELKEAGTHSEFFRGIVRLNENFTDPLTNSIKVSSGKKVKITSESDKNIKASITYFPRAEIINFSAYPNPTRKNHINFRYFLNFPTEISISIFDVSGKKIDSIKMDGKEGENNLRWHFPQKMANGVYIYRVKSLGTTPYYTYSRSIRGKFAVLR